MLYWWQDLMYLAAVFVLIWIMYGIDQASKQTLRQWQWQWQWQWQQDGIPGWPRPIISFPVNSAGRYYPPSDFLIVLAE